MGYLVGFVHVQEVSLKRPFLHAYAPSWSVGLSKRSMDKRAHWQARWLQPLQEGVRGPPQWRPRHTIANEWVPVNVWHK